jgi:guanylate kinase
MLLAVCGPGGAGKSTLCRRLVEEGAGLELSVSATTRAPRPGEQDGRDYFFTARDRFEADAGAGKFAEHAEVAGDLYGTPREFLDERLGAGVDVVLDIDVQGAEQVRDAYGGRAVLVFVLPPSRAVLESRLRGRGTDDEERVARRMALAEREIEAARRAGYDYLVINDHLEDALADLAAIRRAERNRVPREGGRAAWVLRTWT